MHKKVICKKCDAVISQCRCMAGDKKIEYDLCDKCKGENERTQCWFCGERMVWGGDHSAEDYGMPGDGIVANLSCPQCEATALFHSAG